MLVITCGCVVIENLIHGNLFMYMEIVYWVNQKIVQSLLSFRIHLMTEIFVTF